MAIDPATIIWDDAPQQPSRPMPQPQAGGIDPSTIVWDDTPITDLPAVQAERPDFSAVSSTVDSTADGRQADGWMPGTGRDFAFGVRSALQSAGGLLGAVGGDAFNNYVANPVARAVGLQEARPYREEAAALADRIGLPKAQTAGDRVLGDVGEALAGTGLTLGAGGGINALAAMGPRAAQAGVAPALRIAAPAENRLASFLTAQPGLQTVSAATGAGASSTARESGASQGNQLIAGLAGGLGPGLVTAGGGAALRGAVRGTSGEQMRNTLADFERLGANPSVGQASGNRLLQGAENLLAQSPTSAGVMARAAERQSSEIRSGLRSFADDLSRNASGERAGRAIKRGIFDEGGFSQQFKATQDQLYGKVDELVPPDTGVLLNKTRSALDSLSNPIKSPGAPNVARLFQNGRITSIGNAVEADVALPTQQQLSLDEAVAKLNQLYASRDAATQDAGRFAAFANDQGNIARQSPQAGVAQRNAVAGQQAADEATGIARERVSQAAEIEQTLGELTVAAQASGGRLPYEAVKKLRSLVGEELQDAGLMANFPRSKFRALYAALSDDLESTVREAGPEAAAAYSRANTYTRAGMKRMEDIESVIDRNGGPEKIYSAALTSAKDGGTTIRAVMQSLPVDSQKAVTAAVIKRLGRANAGAQDSSGEVFSARTFLTNWDNVSPEARKALFDRYGEGFSKQIDQLARVADRIDSGAGVFKNPPGTAKSVAALTYGASLVGSLFTGGTAYLLGAGAGGNIAARWLTNPKTVKLLANATTLPKSQVPVFINYVAQEGQKTRDPDVQALADVLRQAEQEVSNAANDSENTQDRR
ncbi:TPA: hypothetical protein R4K21_003213 [Stenotrophomonas maltophilia]|nr:hypothetical protein [Stenotrophomonas maltophilia]